MGSGTVHALPAVVLCDAIYARPTPLPLAKPTNQPQPTNPTQPTARTPAASLTADDLQSIIKGDQVRGPVPPSGSPDQRLSVVGLAMQQGVQIQDPRLASTLHQMRGR